MTHSKVGRNPFQKTAKKNGNTLKRESDDLLKAWKDHPLKRKKIKSLDDLLKQRKEISKFTRNVTKKTIGFVAKKVRRDVLEPNKSLAPRPLGILIHWLSKVPE